ncbi:60S ribosomal protein L29-1-like [Zingiber officinale]|uniref:60S ribosomal protein L29-1-like n=1 Tax=Zingiber officinale TaxID=94328 RepID=UPI001C4D026A|nr:60S ribosomal protein L29-1-like [Zingiber officinale]XP_042410551.1 60S ribosomal protein L29-1-like [Zingiber officinale]
MAKSKNHTAHNQSYKAHRNGIKKPKKHRHTSTKGMDPKYLRNLRYSRKHNELNKKAAASGSEMEQ